MNENNNTRLQQLLIEIGLLQEELKNTQHDLNDTRQRLALEVGRNAELFSDNKELELTLQRVKREVHRLKDDKKALEEELAELKALIPLYDGQ